MKFKHTRPARHSMEYLKGRLKRRKRNLLKLWTKSTPSKLNSLKINHFSMLKWRTNSRNARLKRRINAHHQVLLLLRDQTLLPTNQVVPQLKNLVHIQDIIWLKENVEVMTNTHTIESTSIISKLWEIKESMLQLSKAVLITVMKMMNAKDSNSIKTIQELTTTAISGLPKDTLVMAHLPQNATWR